MKPRKPVRSRTHRSSQVKLGLVLSVSAELLACERADRRCVDDSNLPADRVKCDASVPGYHWSYPYTHSSSHYYGYGAGGSRSSFFGGGSSSGSSESASSVSRGGFGSHGFGGGGE